MHEINKLKFLNLVKGDDKCDDKGDDKCDDKCDDKGDDKCV